MHTIANFLTDFLPFIGILFGVAWTAKLFNYIFFDYYHGAAFGKIGSLMIGTFMFYKKYEIFEEKKKHKRISKIINNICSYLMLVAIGFIIIFLICLLNS